MGSALAHDSEDIRGLKTGSPHLQSLRCVSYVALAPFKQRWWAFSKRMVMSSLPLVILLLASNESMILFSWIL